MKRFMLFGGETYYPRGGAWDFRGHFDSFEGAKAGATKLVDRLQWVHILDQDEGRIVASAEEALNPLTDYSPPGSEPKIIWDWETRSIPVML